MRKLTTKGRTVKESLTVPERPASLDERDKLMKWSCIASLMVFKGQSAAGAYRAVYDDPDAVACPPAIMNNPKFRAMLVRLRAAQGMSNEEIQGQIEALYLGIINDENAPEKSRLQAAAQLQKLRGLEKIKVQQEVDADEVILLQALTPKKKMLDAPPE